MFVNACPIGDLVWLGGMNYPNKEVALRRSGHALQNVVGLPVAHLVMDHGKIYWEGTPEFLEHLEQGILIRGKYDEWKQSKRNLRRMSKLVKAKDLDVNPLDQDLDLILSVIINNHGEDLSARIRVSVETARKHFRDHDRGTMEHILMRAKADIKKKHKVSVFVNFDKRDQFLIKIVDIAREPVPAPEATPEPAPTPDNNPEPPLTLF
ncbi:hypothetical protein HGB13_02945 [bacterium]|nr:hypothetical protein [bacterium]